MSDDSPPPILYKYQSFNREYLKPVLEDSRVWFGRPLLFNDPFDCFPILDMRHTAAQVREMRNKVVRRRMPGSSRAQRRRAYQDLVKVGRARFTDEDGKTSWRGALETLRVLSLTQLPNHLLMWGHYADRHRGICLGFSTEHAPFASARKVDYKEERPVFRAFERGREALHQMLGTALSTKAPHWEYEQEWRVISLEALSPGRFEPAALKEVIVGAQTTSEDFEWLLTTVRGRNPPVQLKRSRLSAKRYELELIDL